MQLQPENSAIALSDLFPIDEFAKAHPGLLSVATLRWQLRHRDENGLARAVVRVGKKLLISKARYEQWLASQTGAA
jgi:hypothetical protein